MILQRRRATGWDAGRAPTDPVPPPILRWQTEVHIPGIYDLEVDTSVLTPAECAASDPPAHDGGAGTGSACAGRAA